MPVLTSCGIYFEGRSIGDSGHEGRSFDCHLFGSFNFYTRIAVSLLASIERLPSKQS